MLATHSDSLPFLATITYLTHVLIPSPSNLLAIEDLSQHLLWAKPKPIHWPQPISSFLLDSAGHGSLFLRFPHTAGWGPWLICKRDVRLSLMLNIAPHPVDISPFSFFTHSRFKESNLLDRNYQNITQGPLTCLEKLKVSNIPGIPRSDKASFMFCFGVDNWEKMHTKQSLR